ncbi:hypothetical protein EDC04DRAFT_2601544 [Pisolithus marmoratus]|nr:hypothetical protein EDC04DRAFT_2601544 [Pisolithus marmoratus]
MDSHFETDNGYQTDTDAEHAVDEEGEESVIEAEQPDGHFNLAELEILARSRREWMQARKKEKPIILREIYKEFGKMEKNRNLRPAEWQEKEEHITAWLKKPRRTRKPQITVRSAYKYSVRSVVREIYREQVQEKHALMKTEGASQGNNQRIDLYQQALTAFITDDLTEEQLQAAHNISEKWNGPEGPTAEVQARNAKKYGLKFMKNFAEEMWRYCGMRMVCLSGWKDDDGVVQACCDIAGGITFNDIHTLDASWRDYLGTAYENIDVAEGDEVPNMAVNRRRAKKGDPVELVTNQEGQIWIGDLIGRSRDYILQMVRGYLTAHYRRACGRRSATVPFKKLGRYQADMIASRHLPENFIFTVDPSHMHVSAAMELLTFWCERQVSSPDDVFSFQKWLDKSGNLLPTSNGHEFPLEIARKRKHHSREPPSSVDARSVDEDGDPDTEYEGTSFRPHRSHESIGTSHITSRPRKKTPMPRRLHHSREHPTSADASSVDEDEDPDTPYEGTSCRSPLSNEYIGTSQLTSRARKKTPMPRKVPSRPTDAEAPGCTSTDDEYLDNSGHANLPVLEKQPKPKRSTIRIKGHPPPSYTHTY